VRTGSRERAYDRLRNPPARFVGKPELTEFIAAPCGASSLWITLKFGLRKQKGITNGYCINRHRRAQLRRRRVASRRFDRHLRSLQSRHVRNTRAGPLASRADVDAAVSAAAGAYPEWRRTPPQSRIQYLFKFRQLLEQHADEIARLTTQENGKTFAESRAELARGIENVEVACGIPTLMQGYNLEDVASGIDEIMIRQRSASPPPSRRSTSRP